MGRFRACLAYPPPVTISPRHWSSSAKRGDLYGNLPGNHYHRYRPYQSDDAKSDDDHSDRVNATQDTIATWANTSFNVAGGNDTVYLAPGDQLGLLGGGMDTVVGFNEGVEHLSFAGETLTTEAAVVATAQLVGGNTVLTFPDHTSVVLLGLAHVDTGIFA